MSLFKTLAAPCPKLRRLVALAAPWLYGTRYLSNPLRPSPVKIYRSLCPTAWDAGTPRRDTSPFPIYPANCLR